MMRRRKRTVIALVVFFSILCLKDCSGVHISGTFSSRDVFRFLIKFGFQKTDKLNDNTTQGFVYGNLTLESPLVGVNNSQMMKFLVVDAGFFADVYKNSPEITGRVMRRTCQDMFDRIGRVAFDARCKPGGTQDFMRTVPCARNKLCEEEDAPEKVLPGYQFTFRVQDVKQPRFWYVSLVSCYLDDQCQWQLSDATYANPSAGGRREEIRVRYDLWLVNGNPNSSHLNPFEHQFSFEQHDVFEVYLAFLAVYLVATCVQLHSCSRLRRSTNPAGQQRSRNRQHRVRSQSSVDHFENNAFREREETTSRVDMIADGSGVKPRSSSADRADSASPDRKPGERVPRQSERKIGFTNLRDFLNSLKRLMVKSLGRSNVVSVHTASLIIMDANLLLNLLHSLVYAFDGNGLPVFVFLANCLQLLSESIFIVLLWLISRGWYVENAALPFRNQLRFTVCVATYLLTNLALEAWSFAARMPIEDVDEYQTSAFIGELALRLVVTCLFLYSVWRTSRDGVLAQAVGETQDFFYQFAAGFLVYFIYLPFLVLICVEYVSALWRFKTIMSVRYAVNFLAYACMVNVTWPSRRPAFFIFQKDYEHIDEVESSWLSSDSESTQPTAPFLRDPRSSDAVSRMSR